MEVVNCVRLHFHYRSKKTKAIIIFLFVAVFIVHVISFFNTRSVDVLNLVNQIAFLIIIVTWVYFAPKLYEKFSNIERCFDISTNPNGYKRNASFQKLYERSRKDVYILDKQNRVGKISYIILWFSLCFYYLLEYNHFGMITGNVLTISLTIVLYGLSVFLNSVSWYISVLYTFFLVKVSRMTSEELNQLPHNKYIPSLSSGIKELLLYAEANSMIFLLVSLLYAASFFISFKINAFHQGKDFFSLEIIRFMILTFFALLPGMTTYLVIFLSPRYFLRRILRRWKYQTLREFEHDLYQAENFGDASKIQLYKSNIQVVAEDRLRYERNLFEFVLVSTTLLSNIAIICSIFVRS